MVAVSSNQVDKQVDVDNFSNSEDLGGQHVPIHVVVAVPVADQRSEDETCEGSKEEEVVNQW